MAIAAASYPYVLAQLSPAMGFLVYGSGVAYLRFRTAQLDKPATRRVPWWKPTLVGILFSLHNVLRNLGNRGNVIPGYVTLLLAKLIVPVSAGLSMLPPLRRRLDAFQWGGMVVLLCGVAITIAPDLGSSSPSSNTFGTGAGGFVVLQCVAVVPLALAMLFVELQVYCRSASLFVCVGVWVRACVRACVSAYPSVSLPLCLLVSLSLSLSLSLLMHFTVTAGPGTSP
jgi:drug/metabolite transporter (DMT)-like permease